MSLRGHSAAPLKTLGSCGRILMISMKVSVIPFYKKHKKKVQEWLVVQPHLSAWVSFVVNRSSLKARPRM